MAYYEEETGKWRGVIKYGKTKRKTKLVATEREAVEWETLGRAERDRNRQQSKTRKGILSISNNCIGPLVEEYLIHLQGRNKPREWKEKFNFLRKFLAIVPPKTHVSNITPDMVMAFIDRDQTRSGNARNKDLKRLDAAWAWGVKRFKLPYANPFVFCDKFPELRKAKYIPPFQDVLKVTLSATGEERLILMLCLVTAARRVEMFRIKVETDFIPDDCILVLTTEKTNGNGERRDKIKIPDELSQQIQRHIENNSITEALFDYVSPDRKNWDKWLKDFCIQNEVKPFTIHGIRHRVATELIKKKIELTDIQALLRHTRASTTDKYIHNIGESLDITIYTKSVLELLKINNAA